ncbi:glycosyltransferase family 39 protein [Catellatospora sp. NPDC049609]|uniref:glycosyltransferase family 39 protein n=1 Tax=Catellatospora sp. NPDC049609 TaxID=3155505 RepID=UPI0034169BB4
MTPDQVTCRCRGNIRDAVLWCVVAAAVVGSFAFRLATNRSQVLDYDDGVYWQTALAIAAGGQPYTEVFHAQPPLFPWLVAQPFALWGDSGEPAARFLMVGFTALLAATAAAMAAVLRGARAGMLAALAVAVFPLVQRYSFQFGADLPAAALGGVAVCLALRARTAARGRGWWWAASGAALCLAALVKLIAVVVVPSVALALLTTAALAGPARRFAWLRRTAAAAGWFLAGFAAAAGAAVAVLRPGRAAWDQVFALHLRATDTAGGTPDVIKMIDNTGDWGLPYFTAAAVGAVLAIALPGRAGGRPDAIAITLWALAVVPFGYLHHPTFKHHVLLFIAPAGALIVLGAAALWAAVRLAVRRVTGERRRWAGALLVLPAVAAALWHTAGTTVAPELKDTAVEACLRTLPRDIVLVADDQAMLARAGLRTPPWLVDTSHVRIDSGWLTDGEIVAAATVADGVMFARPRRIGKHPEVRAWAKEHFTVRYTADRYELYLRTTAPLAGCVGTVKQDGKTVVSPPVTTALG